MSLEEEDSSDTNNNDAEIDNEENTKITNEQRSFKGLDLPILLHCNTGKAAIAAKNSALQRKCDE